MPDQTNLVEAPNSSEDSVASDLARIVGESFVDVTSETRDYHAGGLIPVTRKCRVVVRPASTTEVSQVVQYANAKGFKVWPFSTGKNWGYGTTQALQDGVILMLLDRMNRIVEVNEDLAYAVLEPGVTQEQLNTYLKEKGLKLWMDCTDSTPEGSVIGNALERGVGYTPYGDHFGQLCGMEVVLPDGQALQTGGCQPGCHTLHTHKWGTGPFLDGLFSQSNLGIVTQAGIWLMPEPEEFNFMAVELDHAENLPKLVEHVRQLALTGTIGNVHCFNPFLLLSSRIPYPFEQRGARTHLPQEEVTQLAADNHVAPYSLVCGIYGTKAQVRAARKKVKQLLGGYCRLLFANDRQLEFIEGLVKRLRQGEHSQSISNRLLRWFTKQFVYPGPLNALELVPKVAGYHKGIPNEFIVRAAYFKRRDGRPEDVDPVRDNCGLTWLAPIVPATGEHVCRLRDRAAQVFEKHGFEFPFSLIMLNPRTLILAMPMFYDKEDPNECERVKQLYEEMICVCSELGYQQYRTGAMYLDRILSQNEPHQALVRRLKSSLDKNNTLSPGKYGTRQEESQEPVLPTTGVTTAWNANLQTQ